MGNDARNPSGSNEPQTTAEEVMAVMEAGEPHSTKQIQEALDLPHATAHHRLNKIADDGLIEKKKLGPRTVVWVVPEGYDE